MAKNNTNAPSPLTFDLPLSLISKLTAQQKQLGLKSTSEVVRLSIEQFDYDKFEASSEEHSQISVRLPGEMKYAKKKKVSVGELLRVAIDALEAKSKKSAKRGR
jgi:hypothetical protein